jgi:hypothetical protein
MTKNKLFLFFCSVFVLQLSFASRIDNAFGALKQYDYFKAKQLFYRSLKKQPAAASYGLAIIYFRNDNPFHQLDSAYQFILRADSLYPQLTPKSKEKFALYNVNSFEINALKEKISSSFFQLEMQHPSELSLNAFLKKHPWSQEKFKAIHIRDSIVYEQVIAQHQSQAIAQFLAKYPETAYLNRAKNQFNLFQYEEETKDGTLSAYIDFERNFPTNPYLLEAQDSIYKLLTKENTVSAFSQFIQSFPGNRNTETAWRKLYQLYTADYAVDVIQRFQRDFPNYPFTDELNREQQLASAVLIPFKNNNKFGWMELSGQPVISAQYSSVGFYKEDLAWVEKDGLYGFVNKANELIIACQFASVTDFEKGRAIVEVDNKFGCIDRTGKLIIPVIYEDLGTLTEGLHYMQLNGLYGYIDAKGKTLIAPQFDEAYSFNNGKAFVKLNNKTGIIDSYGAYILQPEFDEVTFFSDSLYVLKNEGKLIFLRQDQSIKASYFAEEIGKLVMDRAMLVQNNKVGYVDGQGALVIPALHDAFSNVVSDGEFVGNYAKVSKGQKFGIIDRTGKVIVPIQHQGLGKVSGLIACQKAGKWGFIDLTNKFVIQPIYDEAHSFSDGLAQVRLATGFGLINPAGQIIIPTQFSAISLLEKQLVLVEKEGVFGIYRTNGKEIVPVEYQQIRKIQPNLLLLSKGVEIHYFNLETQTIIQPILP